MKQNEKNVSVCRKDERCIEDHDKMFGIFSRIPEKVMILPGLSSVFEKFIQVAIKSRIQILKYFTPRKITSRNLSNSYCLRYIYSVFSYHLYKEHSALKTWL